MVKAEPGKVETKPQTSEVTARQKTAEVKMKESEAVVAIDQGTGKLVDQRQTQDYCNKEGWLTSVKHYNKWVSFIFYALENR